MSALSAAKAWESSITSDIKLLLFAWREIAAGYDVSRFDKGEFRNCKVEMNGDFEGEDEEVMLNDFKAFDDT